MREQNAGYLKTQIRDSNLVKFFLLLQSLCISFSNDF